MRVRYTVEGRVQGVGFRYFVRRTAESLGIIGWVRNLPDGAVEALARGDQQALDAFESSLRKGPPGASVTGIRAIEISDESELPSGFHITR
jgi:acylphosphatase